MLKTFFLGFGGVLLVGIAAAATYIHFHESAVSSSSSAPSSDVQRAIASMPEPTSGHIDGGTQPGPNDWKKIQDEDERNRAEQNWKADHVKPAQPGDSNVSAEDMQELQDTENAKQTPVNRPK